MSEPGPASVQQLEFEAAMDAVLAVLALYSERIMEEERLPEPDEQLVARLVADRIAYASVLYELNEGDADEVARIAESARADLDQLL